MKRLDLVLLSLLAVLAGRALLANGGGYSFGVKFTGSLAPFQSSGTEKVRIVDEKLQIDLRRTEAAVVVNYTMRNQSKEPATVKFGFPVEAQKDDDFDEEDQGQPAGDPADKAKTKLTAAMQQLKGYTVRMDGNPVPAEFLPEPFASGKILPFPGSEALKDIAGWMVSEVVFPAASTRSIEIRYTADHQGDSTSVSDDYESSPLAFHYRLSTGAVWNGPIETGTVTVKVDGIPSAEVEIVKPAGRFKRAGDGWVWKFTDLEPTLADDIVINAVPGWTGFAGSWDSERRELSHIQHLDKWGEGHQHFAAIASSSLKSKHGLTYGPENLARWFDPSTYESLPWCEGAPGMGIGEFVELKARQPKRLLAIGIISGYQKMTMTGQDLFARNGRPSRVEIVLNDDHRFPATLGDQKGEQLISLNDYSTPVSKLRLIIKDAYAGTQYQDTCISKVILYDLLAKKPNIRPAR